MTIIKLDAKAIEVLFPEGSEQRVELQKCVIAEFAKKAWSARSNIPAGEITSIVQDAISDYDSKISKALKVAFDNIQLEKLKGLGYAVESTSRSGWYRDVKEIKLSSAFADQIRCEVQSAVQGAVRSEIRDAVSTAVKAQLESGSTRVLVKSLVEDAVKADVITQVQQLLNKSK